MPAATINAPTRATPTNALPRVLRDSSTTTRSMAPFSALTSRFSLACSAKGANSSQSLMERSSLLSASRMTSFSPKVWLAICWSNSTALKWPVIHASLTTHRRRPGDALQARLERRLGQAARRALAALAGPR